jgi:hypothetical protein
MFGLNVFEVAIDFTFREGHGLLTVRIVGHAT